MMISIPFHPASFFENQPSIDALSVVLVEVVSGYDNSESVDMGCWMEHIDARRTSRAIECWTDTIRPI